MSLRGSNLHRTWSDFVQALYSPAEQDFNALYWLYRLLYALLDTAVPCRDDLLRNRINRLTFRLRPLIPSVGIILTLLCVGSYFTCFRDTAVINKSKSDTLHTTIVVWLASNILGHYFYCMFKSPGIVIPPKQPVNPHDISAPEWDGDAVIKFGGCCFLQSRVKIKEEKKRNSVYSLQKNSNNITCYSLDVTIDVSTESALYHPMPNDTFCTKCETSRPARSHHCRICNLCVLEYDHHCPWINSCIGHDNYRNFILLVFYIMFGCWYGTCMLVVDFIHTMREYTALHGFKLMGPRYGTGLLDLPPPWVLLRDYRSKGRIDDDVILRAVFPFLLLVSICMSVFLLDHLLSIARGYTTLEKKTRPDRNNDVNPFDLGVKKNFERVFGNSLIRIIFPFKDK